MAFGLTPTGFVPRIFTDLRSQIDGLEQAAFGASFDVSDGSAAGEINAIVAAALAEVWEVAEQVASSTNRDAAVDTRLDDIGALTGTLRLPAVASTAILTFTGDPLTVVGTGFRALTVSTSAEFGTSATTDNVLIALPAWVGATLYAISDRVTNSGRVYICTTSGTSAGSGGPTSQALSIPDGSGSLVWAWVGDGTAAVDIVSTATVTGPTIAVARDLTVIKTPVGGVTNVTNLLDAVLGRTVETNAAYRVRQLEDLSGAGAGTTANIRALLLRLTGVTAAHVFQNVTDTVDADGVPPHSIEALVQDGDAQEIVDTLGEEVSAGITTVGTSSGSHTDSEGITFTVHYSRPAALLIYLRVLLTKLSTTYASDTATIAALVAYGASEQVIGKDAVPSSIGASMLPVRVAGVQVAGVTGVIKVTDVMAFTDVIGAPVAWVTATAYSATVGARSVVTNDGGRAYICITAGTSGATGPIGTGTNITDGTAHWRFLGADIPVTDRQIALLDTTRITITSTNGSL